MSSPDALDLMDIAAYAGPFPDASYQAGVRRFPQFVLVEPEMQGIEECQRARQFWFQEWAGKGFMAVGLKDPVLGMPVMDELHTVIRGCPPLP